MYCDIVCKVLWDIFGSIKVIFMQILILVGPPTFSVQQFCFDSVWWFFISLKPSHTVQYAKIKKNLNKGSYSIYQVFEF